MRHDGKKSKHSLKINQTTEAQNTMIKHQQKWIINHVVVCLKLSKSLLSSLLHWIACMNRRRGFISFFTFKLHHFTHRSDRRESRMCFKTTKIIIIIVIMGEMVAFFEQWLISSSAQLGTSRWIWFIIRIIKVVFM